MSTSHLHLIMTAQEYIQSKLETLHQPLDLPKLQGDKELAETIVRLVTSKKFRKFALDPTVAENIKASIRLNVEEREPIKFTLVFGGYKLWRLEETPEVDWAELFAMIYYTNWMKPICSIYEPGVWFDFFSDDVIVPRMNNISPEDTKKYQTSFKKLLDFIKPYQPKNLNMTLNRVGDQYSDYEEFEADLNEQVKTLAANLENGLPVLDDKMRAAIDLNVKVAPEQEADPRWREKVQLMHDAYSQIKGRRPYYRKPDKMNVMTTPLKGMLSVGTTKDSIAKFWAGAGALKSLNDSYRQLVLSPNQLENNKFTIEEVSIAGLSGKNFKKIRIIK